MVHLYSGIPLSWKKEGAPTLHNSVDETEEHYTKWNKPGSKRQIPYDLTYKWNLINKTNKWEKYNQRHGNKEQSDSKQRGEGKGERIQVKEGEGASKRTWIEDSWTGTMGDGAQTVGVRGAQWGWAMGKQVRQL